MKRAYLYILGFVATMSLSTAAMADDVYGTMMVVKGDVKITSAKTKQTDPGKVGGKVYPGDMITAGSDSRAKIVMSDKNVLNISPDSQMTIAKYESNAASGAHNVELKVDYGKVRASVEQKYDGEKNQFNIRTPTAVAGVRGTDFLTAFNKANNTTQVTTFSGVVAVGQPGANGKISNPVYVKPGQTTNVMDGKAPEAPKAVPKEDLNNMKSDSASDNNKKADDKKDAKGSDKKSAEGDKKADNGPAVGDKKADGGDKRTPASDSSAPAPSMPVPGAGPSMVDSKDLDIGQSKTIQVNSGPAQNNNNVIVPPPPPPQPPKMPDAVTGATQAGGKANVTVRIRN